MRTPVTPTVETLRPFGAIFFAEREHQPLDEIAIDSLRELVLEHRLLILRGFAAFSREALPDYCGRWGELLKWNFGTVLDVRVHEEPKNYLFTSGSVPLHWDGAFAASVPSFQFFQCLKAPLPGTGGETTYCDTVRVWENASPAERAEWEKVRITYRTEKVAHYGGEVTAALAGRHPLTGKPTLRFAEPADDDTVPLNTPSLRVRGLHEERVPGFLDRLRATLYHPDHCYLHAWRDGDLAIADNHALLHGRRAFRSHSPRHLQRVHIL